METATCFFIRLRTHFAISAPALNARRLDCAFAHVFVSIGNLPKADLGSASVIWDSNSLETSRLRYTPSGTAARQSSGEGRSLRPPSMFRFFLLFRLLAAFRLFFSLRSSLRFTSALTSTFHRRVNVDSLVVRACVREDIQYFAHTRSRNVRINKSKKKVKQRGKQTERENVYHCWVLLLTAVTIHSVCWWNCAFPRKLWMSNRWTSTDKWIQWKETNRRTKKNFMVLRLASTI